VAESTKFYQTHSTFSPRCRNDMYRTQDSSTSKTHSYTSSTFAAIYTPEYPENCHLNVKNLLKTNNFFKKIAKKFHFFQNNYQWQFSGGSAPHVDSLSGLAQPQIGSDWLQMGQPWA